ncbi:hypothetical protein TIFTF001_025383 [Ficus carica]|uniref:F-box domain-containing protein n=1 Tax=Ficus carica TaxID=3494 RepID=A0AA88APU9_FICCA|nr:hypothetical protein TIFTF001_025383 [Ficus carica]
MDMEIDAPIIDSTSNFELPDQVIHKILSFLPRKDSIRVSASSKQWRSAWVSSPVFSFDEDAVPFKNSDFFDNVDASLALWRDRCDSRVTMERLSLSAAISEEDSFSRLKQVVVAATSCNVKVIEILNCNFDVFLTDFDFNSLWPLLFACNSLDVLSLKCFQFLIPNSLSAISSLSKLTLSCCFIDDNSLKNLLSCFPSLKDLAIGFCYGFNELRFSLPSLRTMEISICDDLAQKVVIDAVNLRHFTYDRTFRAPGIVSFLNCKSLTSLHLRGIDFNTAATIDDYISQIPLLETLILDSCRMQKSIQISHSSLKSLVFKSCWSFRKAEINTPNLCFFRYCGGIFHIPTFRYRSGFLDAKLDLVTGSFDCTEWFWFIRLRNFLESFSNCKVLALGCYLEGFTEQLRDNHFLPDPFYELKHFKITNRSLPIENYSSFVDAMVELFPCVETLSLKTSSARIFIELEITADYVNSVFVRYCYRNGVTVTYTTLCLSIAARCFDLHIGAYSYNSVGQRKIPIEQKLCIDRSGRNVFAAYLPHEQNFSKTCVCLVPKNPREEKIVQIN